MSILSRFPIGAYLSFTALGIAALVAFEFGHTELLPLAYLAVAAKVIFFAGVLASVKSRDSSRV
ncbi:MAG: hypothetical protein NVSMB14_10210 [Isosphaeraceae bacterium]